MKCVVVVLLAIGAVFASDNNPDENPGINDPNLFEGDMILTPKQRYKAEHGMDVDSSDRKRGSSTFTKWPGGVVLYAIDPSLSDNSRAMAAIRAGMDEWITKTCIRFKLRTTETAYVYFRWGSGCSSNVGRTGRLQVINLAPGCWFRGIVAHEIGHALGFFHEQSRPDRDAFVEILRDNIQDNRKNNFLKYGRSTIDSLGTPYDYRSVMHYGSKAFSKNGQPTIRVKQDGAEIGQRDGLSDVDARQANLLYGCAEPTVRPTTRSTSRPTSRSTQEPTTTPTPGPATPSPACSNYKTLSEADREKGFSNSAVRKCDRFNFPKAWYRFTGSAGQQMPTQVVSINHCGTHAPGWLTGGHPTVAQGVVFRRVCFHWAFRNFNSNCLWSVNIRVQNCGDFFVYELPRTPTCNLRYCGENLIAPTTTPTPAPTTSPTTPVRICPRDRFFYCRLYGRLACRFPFFRQNCQTTCPQSCVVPRR